VNGAAEVLKARRLVEVASQPASDGFRHRVEVVRAAPSALGRQGQEPGVAIGTLVMALPAVVSCLYRGELCSYGLRREQGLCVGGIARVVQ